MGRNRVLSFMSHFSSSHHNSQLNGDPKNVYNPEPTPSPSPPNGPIPLANGKSDLKNTNKTHSIINVGGFRARTRSRALSTPIPASPIRHSNHDNFPPISAAPISIETHRRTTSRSSSRPLSMVQAYQPPVMDVNEDTIPELQPIFTFLNSHGNKLYQEGYFLKLDDQNTYGKPNPDRTWTECFAQLVGTVLSLWDAAELDAAGEDGEVLPKFVNLTDASIKMIESLPTRSDEETPLQNILSISTAGRNRYLLHFNSRASLIQWTAGIRLAMFEHSTLQEAYTGALIAGKGKTLNNIGVIMERARTPIDQWVRVRFGAGVPWRRCWCVITPPDDKEYQKAAKEHKKKSPYDRSQPILKGDIKFYESRKDGKKAKKMLPIATISDAYSAYALYPQAKSLIDASTLIKIEGNITIHTDPPTSSEGFVFIMPEVHPAVSGFEMMLRFLFPTWDTFALYGRPGRLVASVLDSRSLMFAMPKHKRYGYLELLDVSGLILSEGSSSWKEREWRKKLKELTGTRMNAIDDGASASSSQTNSQTKRLSFGQSAGAGPRPRVGFADDAPTPPSVRTSRSLSLSNRPSPRTDSAPPGTREYGPSGTPGSRSAHARNASDSNVAGPMPPPHPENSYSSSPASSTRGPMPARALIHDFAATPDRISSDDDHVDSPVRDFDGMQRMQTPEPVSQPPSFSHAPGHVPSTRPYHSPEMRRANSRLSLTTLAQLQGAGGVPVDENVPNGERQNVERRGPPPQEFDQHGPPPPVHVHANLAGMSANTGSREALRENQQQPSGLMSPQMAPNGMRSRSPLNQAMQPPHPGSRGQSPGPGQRPGTPNSRPGTASGNRPPPPPGYGPPMGMAPGHPGHPGQRGPPPYGMAPPGRGRGRGRPPPNMTPQGRGQPNYPPHENMYRGYPPQGPPQGPPGPGGPERTRSPAPANRRPNPPPLNTSPPVNRKPLPTRSDSLQHRQVRDDLTPQSPSTSNGSLTGHRLDATGLGQIRPLNPGPRGGPNSEVRRQITNKSQSSSRYDDSASTDSPDYASSRPSTDTASSNERERPRAGVLRTIGNTDDSPLETGPHFDIPDIDFGPTVNYANAPPTKAPTLGSPPARAFSPGPPSRSPARTPATPRRSPGAEAGHGRQESEDTLRRSVIWQPAVLTAASSNHGSQGISAEEFVQQRAAAASAPLYTHQRHSSGNTLSGYRAGTPTPPLTRGQGSDYIGMAHSRNNSSDLLQRPGSRGAGELLQRPNSRGPSELLQQRPGSRGAGAVLGGQGGSDIHLSAREQEHVARVTGTPLISMAGNKNPTQTNAGLVGAIEAREREKHQMKQGWSSQAAQHAINQRQQQAFQHYPQPVSSPPPSGMYSNLGRGSAPQSPNYGSYGNAVPLSFEQEGNWSSPGPGFRSPPPGNFDPRFGPQSPPSFSAQSPPPTNQRGPGNYPYHGQAF